jgi:hypothetical protein
MVIDKIIKIHEREWKLYIQTHGESTRLRIILSSFNNGDYFIARYQKDLHNYSIRYCTHFTHVKQKTGTVNTIKEVKIEILKFLTNS